MDDNVRTFLLDLISSFGQMRHITDKIVCPFPHADGKEHRVFYQEQGRMSLSVEDRREFTFRAMSLLQPDWNPIGKVSRAKAELAQNIANNDDDVCWQTIQEAFKQRDDEPEDIGRYILPFDNDEPETKMISNEDKYKKALQEIASLQPKIPSFLKRKDSMINNFAGGNIDDAYDIGVNVGMWYASEIAQETLKEALEGFCDIMIDGSES